MLKTNKEMLPLLKVQGQISHPKANAAGRMTNDGQVLWVPGTGGITLNATIGDCCIGWAADHLEPGVSSRNPDDTANAGYNTFSCVGNEATIISGDAKGAKGVVTGKHGGIEHVMVYFKREDLEKMEIGDKISVASQGQGMTLCDYPEVLLRNMGPELLEKMNIKEEGGKVHVGVAKIIPACVMGSGLGSRTSTSGDYDITLHDPIMTEKYGLKELRFGDIVALQDADTRYGRTFRTGAVTIGVVIHGDSFLNGHGPGVTTLMACKDAEIVPFVDKDANLATYFVK